MNNIIDIVDATIECMLRLFAIAFGPMGRAVGKAMALACTGSCTAPVLGPVLVLGACTGAVLALVHFKHAVLYWLYWHPLRLACLAAALGSAQRMQHQLR